MSSSPIFIRGMSKWINTVHWVWDYPWSKMLLYETFPGAKQLSTPVNKMGVVHRHFIELKSSSAGTVRLELVYPTM